jgi:hypothetical protein
VGVVKRVAANAALALGGVLAALVIAELAMRVAGLSYPTTTTFLRADYYTGWSHKPGITFPNPVDGLHGFVSFNRYGMRDNREYTIAKPPGTFRIAVIGDSFAEALQVPQAEDFCSVVERELARCDGLRGRKIEVLNFGVYGFGTAQELIMLRRRVLRWSPDLVVLEFYANDLGDNTRATDDSWSWGPRPYFVLQNGRLTEDDSFRSAPSIKDNVAAAEWNGRRKLRPGLAPLYGLIINSRVRELIYHFSYAPVVVPFFHLDRWIEHRVFFSPKQEPPPAPGKAAAPPAEPGTLPDARPNHAPASARPASELEQRFRWEGSLLGPPRQKEWRESWQVTERLIEEIARESHAHGARFLLMIADASAQAYPDPELRRKVLPEPVYLNRRLETLGKRDGFAVLSLAEPLQRYADAHHAFLHGVSGYMPGWGHWNVEGHRVVGELLATEICAMTRDGQANASSAQAAPARPRKAHLYRGARRRRVIAPTIASAARARSRAPAPARDARCAGR